MAQQNLTSASVTKARAKFKASAFTELLHHSVDLVYSQLPKKQRPGWHSFRTLAVDGTDLHLPNKSELLETFGGQKNQSDQLKPMTKLSCLYDVYLDMPLDARLGRKHASERELAVHHLELTQDNDLLLYDRGYYAYWFVLQHVLKQREFCFRVRRKANKQIEAFIQSGKKQVIISLEPTEDMTQQALNRGLSITPFKVRLIRIKTSKGYYTLLTSLTDTRAYPMKDFYTLYHARWRIEEGYKTQKCFLEIENFSGQSVHTIQQDVHASILMHALTAISCIANKCSIAKSVTQRKRKYKQSVVMTMRSLKAALVDLLHNRLDLRGIYLWLKNLAMNLTVIKPDRSFERKKVRCRRQILRAGYK